MKLAKKVLSAKYHKKYYTSEISYIFTYYVHHKIQSLAIINAMLYQYFLYYVAIASQYNVESSKALDIYSSETLLN